MIKVNTPYKNDSTIRTQITLTKELKQRIEQVTRSSGESLSEFLRLAAISRLEEKRILQEERKAAAESFIGCMKGHSEFTDEESVQKWLRSERELWDIDDYEPSTS